jgi:RNA polymerase sigma factor, sigma-70 family
VSLPFFLKWIIYGQFLYLIVVQGGLNEIFLFGREEGFQLNGQYIQEGNSLHVVVLPLNCRLDQYSQHATLHVENIDLSDNSKEEQQHEVNSLLEYIDHLIENLPPARREIFRLSRLEQLSNKEIAHKLSISEKTVETQLYRSFQYLRSKLPPDRRWILLFCYFINQC